MTTMASPTLERALGVDRIQHRVQLAPFTTFKIGGPADLFYEARSADELACSAWAQTF